MGKNKNKKKTQENTEEAQAAQAEAAQPEAAQAQGAAPAQGAQNIQLPEGSVIIDILDTFNKWVALIKQGPNKSGPQFDAQIDKWEETFNKIEGDPNLEEFITSIRHIKQVEKYKQLKTQIEQFDKMDNDKDGIWKLPNLKHGWALMSDTSEIESSPFMVYCSKALDGLIHKHHFMEFVSQVEDVKIMTVENQIKAWKQRRS